MACFPEGPNYQQAAENFPDESFEEVTSPRCRYLTNPLTLCSLISAARAIRRFAGISEP
jgi:hypothetical protein